MHSVFRYFTIPRALGGDHFHDQYLNLPLVDQGAFKYSSNAMYSFVFLGMWGIALLTGSWNALVLALFNHAYIWVHMYCTEYAIPIRSKLPHSVLAQGCIVGFLACRLFQVVSFCSPIYHESWGICGERIEWRNWQRIF